MEVISFTIAWVRVDVVQAELLRVVRAEDVLMVFILLQDQT